MKARDFEFYYLLGQDNWSEIQIKQKMIIVDLGRAPVARGILILIYYN